MRMTIQRAEEASVFVEGRQTGTIGNGLLIFIGFANGDTSKTADFLMDKVIKLRIFADENGKTNLSLAEIGGSILLVSQFTLYADCRKGNRPNFTGAAGPEEARSLYDYCAAGFRLRGVRTEEGVFGAHMKVSLVNDGPFTICLDSVDFEGKIDNGKINCV